MSVQKENSVMKQLWSLRSEDPTQYYTLVKMHLSFATDLSTDQCDGLMEEKVESPSGKSSGRWNLTPLIRRLGRPMGNAWRGVMEGAPLTQEGVCQAYQLIHYLNRDYNITQEGLFRKSGSVTRQQELKALLNSGRDLNLDYGNYSAHDCASVLKNFLADLPEPLLSESHYKIHCKIAEMNQSTLDEEKKEFVQKRQIKALRLLFLLLPHENYRLLKDLLMLLNRVTKHQDQNKMTSINLGTMFAPPILCPRKMTPNDLQYMSGSLSHSVAFMIDHCAKLFQIPIELEYDVRQYWSNKKTLKHQLSKDAPTNTIFTFIDRELTAQANNQDVTDVALAELYAYVQSLPDSAKKRRLIKQFNKENGPGTPHLNNSVQKKSDIRVKSLGDSIKRHLFQKSIRGTKNKKESLSVGRQVSVKRVGSEDLLTSPNPTSPELHMFRQNKDPETSEMFKAKSLDDLASSMDDCAQPERLVQNQTSIVHPAFHPSSHLLRNLKRAPPTSLSHELVKERLSSTSLDVDAADGMLSPLPAMPSFSLDSSAECLDVTEEEGGNTLTEDSILTSDELSLEMKTSILTGGSDKNVTSPISQAVFKSSIPQRVIMTPRSRIPIIFNSSSSLSGVPIPENLPKAKDTADSPVIPNPCASMDSPARNTRAHHSRSSLQSPSVSVPSLPSVSQNPAVHTEETQMTFSDDSTSVNSSLAKSFKANSMSTLRRTLSSASSTGSLFGSFFKHLSTSSLAVLASRLTSTSSLSAAATADPEDLHEESLHVEDDENEEANESLSSVFKDYLINRSILTDKPVDLSADCLHESFDGDEENQPPREMPDALEDSRDSACVVSSSSSTLASQQVSKASLASFDSAISVNQLREPLSESLLYCLDGNYPDPNVCLSKREEQSGPKSAILQDQNKIDQHEVAGLHSCSPNGRQHSLLQNKQGTPVPVLEKDWQESHNSNQGVLFETSF
ncbi:uncharacterized protein LOC143027827 isoform X2 [Oratosquilla oratoria]|uniref:uncharacterized protein LOC143027827 isoform X2 n=1 Tax=Oratosquilla oratoria TaxID=337810 RepID=UPI003F761382